MRRRDALGSLSNGRDGRQAHGEHRHGVSKEGYAECFVSACSRRHGPVHHHGSGQALHERPGSAVRALHLERRARQSRCLRLCRQGQIIPDPEAGRRGRSRSLDGPRRFRQSLGQHAEKEHRRDCEAQGLYVLAAEGMAGRGRHGHESVSRVESHRHHGRRDTAQRRRRRPGRNRAAQGDRARLGIERLLRCRRSRARLAENLPGGNQTVLGSCDRG